MCNILRFDVLLHVICLLGYGDDVHVVSDDDSELEEGEIREPLCGKGCTPQKRSPLEMSERSPPKKARLGLAGYEAERENGSMWVGLRQEWTRIERLSARRGEKTGLGYKGFLSSRHDFGEWVPASKV